MNRVTLNIPYDMPSEKWNIIDSIYKNLSGWQGYGDDGCPSWIIDNGNTVYASVEPSGLCFESDLVDADIEDWVSTFIKNASLKLGFEVKDAAS